MNFEVFNTFEEDLSVTRLSSLPSASHDAARIYFEGLHLPKPVLRSGRLSNLGRVLLMPPLDCASDYCYLGLQIPTPGMWGTFR